MRFATVYSIPYAGLALVSGHSSTGGPFKVGDLPPILLAITLAFRLGAWRRLFDAPILDGVDERRALLVELFAGVGACSLLLCGLSFLDRLSDWARASEPVHLISTVTFGLMLIRPMTVPAFAATVIGWGMYRSRGAAAWVRAALVFVAVMVVVHGTMQFFFANHLWSRLSAASWTLVLMGFGMWVHKWHCKHPPTPVPGAPHAF